MTLADDTGLSNERTALSWQRTALSLVVAAALLGRLTFDRLGFLAVVLVSLAGLVALWVFVESKWRYVQQRGERARTRARGGRAAAWVSVAALLLALTEVIALASTE